MRNTKETVTKKALSYKTRQEFKLNDNSAYQYAHRTKILDEVCSHMESARRRYTDDYIMEDAKRYSSRYEWQTGSNTYYAAKYKGKEFLDICCSHMDIKLHEWSNDEVFMLAKRYDNRILFINENGGAYNYAKRNGIYEEATPHMDNLRSEVTYCEARDASINFNSRISLYKENRRVYSYIIKNNLQDELFSHMQYLPSSFKKNQKAIVYYICIDSLFYKIGVSGGDVYDRFRSEKKDRIRIIKIWEFETGIDALVFESNILKEFHTSKIKHKILHRGNTEIFTHDVLLLDV